MPPKPIEIKEQQKLAQYYNIDFSLEHQRRLAGAPSSPTTSAPKPPPKDPIARKKRLKHMRQMASENPDSSLVLNGMRDMVNTSDEARMRANDILKKGKKWDEQLEKPKLDYSDIFDDDIGQIPGVFCFEIENFLPNPVDTALNGKFYQGDCYIVLKTFIDDTGSLNWQIYFWIGVDASLDKQACAAMHAVNLRNLLGATCRTIREEQNEESDDFLKLFGANLMYIEGARTSSGFYTVEELEYVMRLYRIHGTARLTIEPVEPSAHSLDPRFVFLLDQGLKIWLWEGAKTNSITVSKARLFAEKINKHERKFQAELIHVKQKGEQVLAFYRALNSDCPTEFHEHVAMECLNEVMKPKLYKVGIGRGYLELPQVELPRNQTQLTRELLDTRNVYILDCYSDVFVWIGRKSTRLVRTAALKLSASLEHMIRRPQVAIVTSILEGTEPQIFKSKFTGWDDLIAVDYTRTADSVARRGADWKKIMNETELKCDLVPLFVDR